MKRIVIKSASLLLTVLVIVSCVAMLGASASTDYYTITSGVLTKCVSSASGVIDDIPSTVTEIKGNAFKGCNAITEVVIPSGVKKVGNNAFDGCTSLKKITFNSASCTIGSAAFIHCSALEEIKLPSNLTEIPNEAFYDCTSLDSIDIPSTVTLIGKEAFNMCRSLTEISIPASVKTIRANAFLGCTGVAEFDVDGGNTVYSSVGGVLYGPLESPHDPDVIVDEVKIDKTLINYPGGASATSFTVPSDVCVIANDAFNGNKTVKKVTLQNGLTSIGSHAFFNCIALETVNIPSSVTNIGERAFDGCKALKSIVIPASVTSFDNAFSYSGLTSVEFANGVKTISTGAFNGCTALATVKIPASVTSIEPGAFNGCPSGMTVVTTKGSYAYTYAVSNGFKVSTPADETTKPSNRTVTSISVISGPDKTEYIYRESISTNGLELQVVYSDGSVETVTSGFSISPNTAERTGNIAVKVEYGGESAYFTVTAKYAWWQWIIRILLLGFLWY